MDALENLKAKLRYWSYRLRIFWKKGRDGSIFALEHQTTSILYCIAYSVSDGELPHAFSVREAYGFADPHGLPDGAQDGMALYSGSFPSSPEDAVPKVGDAIFAASKRDFKTADRLFIELDDEYGIWSMIDVIQMYVSKAISHIDEDALLEYVHYCIIHSNQIPLPKVGLSILEMTGEPNDEFKEIVRIMGLSDEYTLFAIWNMRHWNDGNEEIFQLAKKVHGWGRLHAVNIMKPESDEIRRWLLLNGTDVSTSPHECAADCYVKSDTANAIREDMAPDEFNAAGRLLVAMLDSPREELERIDDWHNALTPYVAVAAGRPLGLDDYNRILRFLEDGPRRGFTGFEETAERILRSEGCLVTVSEAVGAGEGLDLALHLGIPYKDRLVELIDGQFAAHCHKASYASDEEHLPGLVNAFRNNIPDSALADNPMDEDGTAKRWEPNAQLDFLLQELRGKLPIGLDLVTKALTSAVNSNRHYAIELLTDWTSAERMPLEAISPHAYIALGHAYEEEPLEEHRVMMHQLLDGTCDFSDGER